MPGKVRLIVVEGNNSGVEVEFDEPGMLLVGRADDCEISLDDNDASRHHCYLHVNPPDATVRDAGSRGGTFVNGAKHGGRGIDEAPEAAAAREHEDVALRDGDRIKVGRTILEIRVELPPMCFLCGLELLSRESDFRIETGGRLLCDACRKVFDGPTAEAPPPQCSMCGKNVAHEIGPYRMGPYVCIDCRAKAATQPKPFLDRMRTEPSTRRDIHAPVICSYDIDDHPIAFGGMGAVFRARHRDTGKVVAVKFLLSHVAVDESSRQRFLREIEIQQRLQHRNVVRLIDYDSVTAAFYFIMEYCTLGSAATLASQRGGRLSLKEAAPIAIQALEGLAYAHEQKYVHRDLKPGNIMLTGDQNHPTAKIGDFGLAKSYYRWLGPTRTGQIFGTFDFSPREQFTRFKDLMPTSDVWSMGATIYCLLTDCVPYNITSDRTALSVIRGTDPVPIRQRDPSIPESVAKVIDAATAAEPEDRYRNAGDFLEAFRKALPKFS